MWVGLLGWFWLWLCLELGVSHPDPGKYDGVLASTSSQIHIQEIHTDGLRSATVGVLARWKWADYTAVLQKVGNSTSWGAHRSPLRPGLNSLCCSAHPSNPNRGSSSEFCSCLPSWMPTAAHCGSHYFIFGGPGGRMLEDVALGVTHS